MVPNFCLSSTYRKTAGVETSIFVSGPLRPLDAHGQGKIPFRLHFQPEYGRRNDITRLRNSRSKVAPYQTGLRLNLHLAIVLLVQKPSNMFSTTLFVKYQMYGFCRQTLFSRMCFCISSKLPGILPTIQPENPFPFRKS